MFSIAGGPVISLPARKASDTPTFTAPEIASEIPVPDPVEDGLSFAGRVRKAARDRRRALPLPQSGYIRDEPVSESVTPDGA